MDWLQLVENYAWENIGGNVSVEYDAFVCLVLLAPTIDSSSSDWFVFVWTSFGVFCNLYPFVDWVIQSQWLFASIAQHLPMTWELDWVAKEVADGEFECMHGDTECAGNVWASCLLEETDIPKWAPGQYGAWWSMVSETYKDIPENMYAAALNYFLDAATADECAHSDLGKQVMSAAVARAEGVRWAPSIFVNGELACEWNGGDCPAGATQESWTEWICGFYAADDLPPGCV